MSRLVTQMRRAANNSTLNNFMRDVVGSKADTAATGAVTSTDSMMAYVKQLVTSLVAIEAKPGDVIVATSTVVSSGIPNNTQTGGAITAAASGDILVEDIIFNTNGTGLANPTNIEISSDNTNGLTGAGGPIFVEVIASFGANKSVSKKDATSHGFPFVLKSGKKLFIHGDDAAGTGAGTAVITIVGKALTVGASLTGANIAGA